MEEKKAIKWGKVYLTVLSPMPVHVHQKAHTGRFLGCSHNILYKIHIGFMPFMAYLYLNTRLQPESSENRNILLSAHNIIVWVSWFFFNTVIQDSSDLVKHLTKSSHSSALCSWSKIILCFCIFPCQSPSLLWQQLACARINGDNWNQS